MGPTYPSETLFQDRVVVTLNEFKESSILLGGVGWAKVGGTESIRDREKRIERTERVGLQEFLTVIWVGERRLTCVPEKRDGYSERI